MIHDLVIAGIIFRFEAGILLVIIVALEWLVYRTLPFKFMVVHGLASALVSLALTVSVDSYFWQRTNDDGGISLLWPEGAVFYFNVILNKSSEWGTLPFYVYFVSFLPRLLLISYPLAWIAFIRDARVRRIMIPSLIYIGLFSCVPHKEWRFIIYVLPIFTAAAASLVGNALSVARTRSSKFMIATLAAGGMLASLGCSLLMLYVSMHNYPGGHALRRLHQIAAADSTPVSVHMDVPTAMSGASRFGQVAHPQWSYHKNESHITPDDYIEAEYTYLITSDPAFHHKQFQLVDQTWGLEAVKLKAPKVYLDNLKHSINDPWGLLPVDIVIQPKLYTLKLMNPQTTWIQHTLRKHRVVLYSKTYCPYCRRAKQVLNRVCKGSYLVIEVDQRRDGLALKQSLIDLTGRRTFPNLLVDGQTIGGSDEILHLEKSGKLSEILPCNP
ncbi:Alg9-like mannosyltransferase family-domain-containing protein [Zychaea mexicana]|uniref:Alg9-like mannosyltransferase family-domain-containing protein n=1 Tax=Zychaea mexicana TaxID=64656 RepID=UPI0022FEBF74|nr:Alg9-like mannosyltransferase family-domain-containing protein [Zychaea mexicana]KAI9497252.1 Alg9-like mannosyltransferase family-domain-containing protein [Zychaea mexicana]